MEREDAERIRALEEQIKGQDRALALQAKEYERRLEMLNHAYQQAQEERQKYVSVERFMGAIDKIEVWQKHVDRDLSLSSGKNSGILQVITILIAVAAVVVAVLV